MIQQLKRGSCVRQVSNLGKGKTFGELAILRHEQRTHNVISQTHVMLLTVCRRDFLKIFMHRMDESESELIGFMRRLPEFAGYPLYRLPKNKPSIFAFTYFRVGVVICCDSRKSDFIVIIRSVSMSLLSHFVYPSPLSRFRQ
ncbi:MAG: cyclic nucleotide-binding domain-containing protein [Bacteroidota bacterium]